MVLISGIWPPAVTSSSLSPSRRLGIHYTHPTPKATRPKEARPRPESLELPRFLGTARRSTELPRVRFSFMDRVTVGHAGLFRQLLAPRTGSPPPTQPRFQAAGPPPAGTCLHKPQPPQTTAPEIVRDVAVVNFLTEAPPVIARDSPGTGTPAPPPGRPLDVRDKGRPGRGPRCRRRSCRHRGRLPAPSPVAIGRGRHITGGRLHLNGSGPDMDVGAWDRVQDGLNAGEPQPR